jgi:membrane peptidoglycan carboxypeptidase
LRRPPSRRGRKWLLLLILAAALSLATVIEVQTSTLQARFFSRWSTTLHYSIGRGASPHIAFPVAGPFDERSGYTRLAEFGARLQDRGFRIAAQARQAPELQSLIRSRISPPFREPTVAGLLVRDTDGDPLFDAADGDSLFHGFEDVPPLIVETLLFIENRSLGQPAGPRQNPAVDWPRSARAAVLLTGRKLGFDLPLEGGSTLATQFEKYRHSPSGLTSSPAEKLRQVVGATLAAYRAGPDTRDVRREIIVDYLNTMPLAARVGAGQVHGLGNGLRVWFGLDPARVRRALEEPLPTAEKAHAYRHVLALLCAVRAPTTYLVENRNALQSRLESYSALLHSGGVIDAELVELMKQIPLGFAPAAPLAEPPRFVERKAVNAVRLELASLLDVRSLETLDRLHLQVDSTIDGTLQAEVTQLLRQLASPAFVATTGLRAPHFLAPGDPARVTYSFLLLESRPEGNVVRVHADTRNAPFDINSGMKLELGSTAKLRALAHYLEVMAQLHDELSPLGAAALERRRVEARDSLTWWAAAKLRAYPGLDLEAFLHKALARRYSANPAEVFFTGGGIHRFHGFDPGPNVSVRAALIYSTNLVFIRLMRDVVSFYEARLPYDAGAILTGRDLEARRQLLAQIAHEEEERALALAYQRYRNLSPRQILARLLGQRVHSPRHLAMIFENWNGRADPNALASWLLAVGAPVAAYEVQQLARAYDNQRLTLADFGYLLNEHPLELWTAGELARNPGIGWEELLARSQWAREVSSAWLFKTRNRQAQNLRLRARIERDAFDLMTPYWRRLGFPFETLVPSYATAIGSSADRPMALAELMGIIVNDGWRRPTMDIVRLSFAPETPYQTVFEPAPQVGEQVMRRPVARLLRQLLAEVVNRGTAHRLSGVFIDDKGLPTPIGGKTGSGDNRIETFARGGQLLASRAVSRTASFVFYLDQRWYGVITASISGAGAGDYNFTSALPLAVLKLLAPTLNAALREEHRDDDDFYAFELTDTGADTHIARGLNPPTSR